MSNASTDSGLDDPKHPLLAVERNDIKRRIDEIDAGGADQKEERFEPKAAGFKPLFLLATRK